MKSSKKLLITTLVLGVVLGILALGDYDYTISKGIINKRSLFGEFFNLFGELPATIGMLLGVTILYGSRRKEIPWHNILGSIVSLPFMVLFSWFACQSPVRYIYEFSEEGIPLAVNIGVIIVSIIVFVGLLVAINKIGNERMKFYRKYGLILLLLMIIEMILVNVVKVIWARPRMRSMESIDQFKKWYEINGPMNSEEFKSFPSGHTANAFAMIAYTMFIPKDKTKLMKWSTAFAIAWGTCVGLSRVILGAHFLSDVAVAGYITMLVFYLLNGIIIRKPSYDK